MYQIHGVCHDKAKDFSFLVHAHLTICMKASIQEKGKCIIMFGMHESTVSIQSTQSLTYIRDTTYNFHISSSKLYSTQGNTKYVKAKVAKNTTESTGHHLFRVQGNPFLTTVCNLVHPNPRCKMCWIYSTQMATWNVYITAVKISLAQIAWIQSLLAWNLISDKNLTCFEETVSPHKWLISGPLHNSSLLALLQFSPVYNTTNSQN